MRGAVVGDDWSDNVSYVLLVVLYFEGYKNGGYLFTQYGKMSFLTERSAVKNLASDSHKQTLLERFLEDKSEILRSLFPVGNHPPSE